MNVCLNCVVVAVDTHFLRHLNLLLHTKNISIPPIRAAPENFQKSHLKASLTVRPGNTGSGGVSNPGRHNLGSKINSALPNAVAMATSLIHPVRAAPIGTQAAAPQRTTASRAVATVTPGHFYALARQTLYSSFFSVRT